MPAKFLKRKNILTLMLFLFINGLLLMGSNSVSSSDRHGIRGKDAPELDMEYQVNENGEETTAPIKLNAFRGKVVYLMFFQSW